MATLQPIKERFVSLTSEQTFNKEASFALQHIAKSPSLQKCAPGSLVSAVLNVANFGLSLNPVKKEAYIVPRYDRAQGGMVAYLEPSYMGLIKAVTQSGICKQVYAHPVFQDDDFEVCYGTDVSIKHKPNFKSKTPILYYAVAVLGNGEKQVEVMTIDEVNEVRDVSESYKAVKTGKMTSCTWTEWPHEMGRKTVIRRLIKYLPKAGDTAHIGELIAADEADYKPTWEAVHYAEELIKSSSYDHDRQQAWIDALTDMSKHEIDALIIDMQRNQLDRIEAGMMYNQTDIQNKLKQIQE